MSRFLAAIIMWAVSSFAFASINEKVIELPNELGSAVLYSNSEARGKQPGIIVVHEWWGLNDYARDRARQLAKAGYTAIAVDMYGHGKVADHPDNAKAFMEKAMENPQVMTARFNAAKSILAAQKRVDAKRIFAVGYCFGGGVVLNQARMGNDLAGVASFHGSLGSDIKPAAGDIKARILVAHGAADPFVTPDTVAEFMKDMMNAGADLTFISYQGVKHSFTNPGSTEKGEKYNLPLAYDAAADKDSWDALMRFIKEK